MNVQTPATQPGRNGGTLLAGGKPGNRGGPGKTPSYVREVALEMAANRLIVLDQIAGNELRNGNGKKIEMETSERRLATVALCQIGGLSQKIEVEAGSRPLTIGVLLGPKAAELAARQQRPT